VTLIFPNNKFKKVEEEDDKPKTIRKRTIVRKPYQIPSASK